MKRILLSLLMVVMVCGVADAKIKGKIVGKEKTSDEFMRISTEFWDDKNTVDTVDDEQVGATDHRNWNLLKFKGKTKAERKAIIKADLQEKMDGNIIFQYMKGKTESPYDTIRKEEAQEIYDDIPSMSIEFEQASTIKKVDLDGDKLCEEEWTIYPNGTHTRVAITPTSCN